jgi:unsaturated rhamnogalacturonyl hydrolase
MKIFKDYCAAVAKYQDHDTGMWWQIMDKPTAPKNYVETSCSIMFCYALAKGAQHGWIDAAYGENARRGFRGILNKEVDYLAGNRIDLNGTVTVGSLGGNGGFYDYYVSIGLTKNDQKGLGAMMYLTMAMSELANKTGEERKLPRKGF